MSKKVEQAIQVGLASEHKNKMGGIEHILNKTCRICKDNKPVNEFHRLKKWYASYCKLCQANFAKVWRKDNAEAIKEKKAVAYKNMPSMVKFNNHLKQRYGIDVDYYLDMLSKQNGLCKICGGLSNRKRLSVDHCHETGRVRGLLCERCNSFIGRVKDDVSILKSAIDYLQNN